MSQQTQISDSDVYESKNELGVYRLSYDWGCANSILNVGECWVLLDIATKQMYVVIQNFLTFSKYEKQKI